MNEDRELRKKVAQAICHQLGGEVREGKNGKGRVTIWADLGNWDFYVWPRRQGRVSVQWVVDGRSDPPEEFPKEFSPQEIAEVVALWPCGGGEGGMLLEKKKREKGIL